MRCCAPTGATCGGCATRPAPSRPRERALLQRFKGLGDVGVDIFFREVQAAWDELRPFVDRRARKAATELGLPTDPGRLARLVNEDDLTRFLSGLARVDVDRSYDTIRDAAAGRRA